MRIKIDLGPNGTVEQDCDAVSVEDAWQTQEDSPWQYRIEPQALIGSRLKKIDVFYSHQPPQIDVS